MTRTFQHPLWKRLITVDGDGIHEHRRGRAFASIRWDEVYSLNGYGVHSERGTRIILRLSPCERRQFAELASQVWKQRHPDQWQRNAERTKRATARTAYFWLPLLTIGPCVACYLLFWFLGWPESLKLELQKLHHLTILGLLCIGAIWFWFGRWKRKNT